MRYVNRGLLGLGDSRSLGQSWAWASKRLNLRSERSCGPGVWGSWLISLQENQSVILWGWSSTGTASYSTPSNSVLGCGGLRLVAAGGPMRGRPRNLQRGQASSLIDPSKHPPTPKQHQDQLGP